MIFGLAIAGGLVLLVASFALWQRLGEGQRRPAPNTGANNTDDGGALASNASVYDHNPSTYPDAGQCDPRDNETKPVECPVDENSWDNGSDCAPDGGSDGGDSGEDGGGDSGGGGGD